jgi:hypothetical protein
MTTATITRERKAENREEAKPVKQQETPKAPENVRQTVEPMTVKPLSETVGYAEKAHAAHVEAARQVARAYRENELQIAMALRKAEQQAQHNCDSDITAALQAQTEAVAQATQTYDKAVQEAKAALENAKQNAAKTYQANVEKAIGSRDADVAEAHKISDDTSEQSWAIYSRIL